VVNIIHLWSYDPGLVTGWCHLSVHENEIGVFNCGETDHIGIGNMLADNQSLTAAVNRKELEVVFVIERFVMNTKISPQPWSLETIGLVRYFAAHYAIPLHLQSPSEAKGLIKDDVIKRAGLYVPGAGHAMDSVRHALYYLITAKGLMTEYLRA
jgi:hypothetical protein